MREKKRSFEKRKNKSWRERELYSKLSERPGKSLKDTLNKAR